MTTKTAKPKLIRFHDELAAEQRERYNQRALKLLLKHAASIDHIDVLLDDLGLWVETRSGLIDEDDKDREFKISIELWQSVPTGDLRKDFIQQFSDSLGEAIRDLQTAKRRIDSARRKGELPKPPIVAYQVVVDGEIIARYDDAHWAAYRMQGIGEGDVLNEYPDGSTEPSENSFVGCIREDMAKKAATV